MPLPAKLKALSLQQQAFLDYLKGEARGDYKVARDLAGYSPNTRIADIIAPMKEHVANAVRDILILHGPQAAFATIDVMEKPAEMGAANKLKAAGDILDRIGVVTPTESIDNRPKPAVFILPAKGIQSVEIKDGNITINTEGELKTIEAEPNPESDENS